MKRIYRVQRLARKEESAIIKRIFYLSIISVALVIVIFTIGIPLLGRFADLLDSVFNNNTSTISEGEIPLPPAVDTLPPTTNQLTITISGFSTNSLKVEIYKSGQLIDETNVDNGKFEFKDFRLDDGENRLSFRSINASGKSSDYTPEVVIILDKEPPDLEIQNPTEGQIFIENNKIKVSGKTEKNAQVFASGFLANVNNDGNFEVFISLVEGENKIEVKAIDDAQNTTIKEIKVEFKR
ncbi:hypothetical protein A3A49_02425 [Candidatus Curtissbacteria bacterium RIFCSPLOWO2_01_FULL_38_11b]|uniref:Bacterial Ig-like domain-containing protein n=1 Tax=Candidatus Curtissbacteria bacterium RIFCSPLOWO2_01_FULL_38_11b TaxID=1797725 RepID=A0A1F5GZB6_9BACT|nr:MAG: hypothetical protein A3A49_02425 [Candidatus Curtissbacteria bacterium RIFCSPLOWO2_01_FULL_38_11b]